MIFNCSSQERNFGLGVVFDRDFGFQKFDRVIFFGGLLSDSFCKEGLDTKKS